ncbi:26324_t:CDS:2 [Gigaspora margarita]|uniref:26324_t:CDS:1 n=1 Tax=Gigaspora margarita TaxID=4874 RepID=A0ABM8VXS9_GIGMA|nr:26324_t:CDS:2 [Gigaspora margarita]
MVIQVDEVITNGLQNQLKVASWKDKITLEYSVMKMGKVYLKYNDNKTVDVGSCYLRDKLMVVLDAPLDVVSKIDLMMKGLIESLAKHEALNDRSVNDDRTAKPNYTDEKVKNELFDESKMMNSQIKCGNKVAKNRMIMANSNEGISNSKNSEWAISEIENDRMELRKETNYELLSRFHSDVRHEWDRSSTLKGQKPFDRNPRLVLNALKQIKKRGFYDYLYLDHKIECNRLEHALFGNWCKLVVMNE